MNYKIIRTNRKTLAIYVRKNGEVEVRAPYRMSDKKIQEFINEKQDWIIKTQNKIKQKIQNKQTLSIEEKNKLNLVNGEWKRTEEKEWWLNGYRETTIEEEQINEN